MRRGCVRSTGPPRREGAFPFRSGPQSGLVLKVNIKGHLAVSGSARGQRNASAGHGDHLSPRWSDHSFPLPDRPAMNRARCRLCHVRRGIKRGPQHRLFEPIRIIRRARDRFSCVAGGIFAAGTLRLSMFIPFETFGQRTNRAALQGKALAELWSGLDTGNAYSTRVDFQDDGTGEIFVEPVDPDWFVQFSLKYGEMLYQLRAALDSCVYDAAVLHTGKNPPDKKDSLMFPICTCSKKFNEAHGRINPLPEELRTFIESVQPYKGLVIRNNVGIWPVSEALRYLGSWSNIDRHRRLHVVGTLPTAGRIQIFPPAPMVLEEITYEGGGVLEDQSKIGTCKIGNYVRGPKICVHTQLAFQIAVKDEAETVIATHSAPSMLIACWHLADKFKKFFGIA